ncbi:MAG: hypothetical protein AAB215_09570 [Planctomycetota bacterium]
MRRSFIRSLPLFLLLAIPSAQGAEAPSMPPKDRDKAKDEVTNQEDRTIRILRTSNKAQVNRYVPKAYTLKNVNPFSVMRFYKRVMEVEEGSWFTFKDPEKEAGVVLLVCPAYQVPYLDKLMEQIDRAGVTSSSGTATYYYPLKYRDGSDANFQTTVRSFGTAYQGFLYDPEMNAFLFRESPVGKTVLENALKSLDVTRDQVQVEATIYEIDLRNDGTLGLDFHAWKNGPGRNLFALGAFYERGSVGTSAPIIDPGTGTYGLPGHRFSSRGTNAAYLLDVPSAFFDFLAVKGKARIVTQASLSVLNTETARLQAGDEILYHQVQTTTLPNAGIRTDGYILDPFGDQDQKETKSTNRSVNEYVYEYTYEDGRKSTTTQKQSNTSTDTSTSGSDLFPDNRTLTGKTTARSYGSVSTGIFLQVRPVIGTDTLRLQTDFAVVNLTGFQDDGLPLLDNRDVFADLHLKDGEESVLGGLVRERRVKTTRKIPVLGSIPVLGYLFGGEVTQVQRSLVVLTLKPRVKGAGAVTEADASVQARAKGLEASPLPSRKTGFDQYVLDKE